MSSTTYTVSGMTCGCCAKSVIEAVTKIGGVTDADVDVATGAVTVRSEAGVADAAVRAAVEEAGYSVAGA
jgi:copper chaperone